MIDINLIRKNPDTIKEKSLQKGYQVDVDQILALDKDRNDILKEIEALRQIRNELSDLKKGERPSPENIAKVKELKLDLQQKERIFEDKSKQFNSLMLKVPNIALDDVPIGKSEDENQVVKKVGDIPVFDFTPRNHLEIAEGHDWLDRVRAAKVAGSRFNYLKGSMVNLQFAIVTYVINTLGNPEIIKQILADNNLELEPKPFIPVIPPALIKTDVYEASARLDAEEVTYKIEQDDLWLNASAEHSLCTMYKDEVIAQKDLPIRYIGYSTSFRREAGSYGKDMEGMIRNHQFDKLEMEVFCLPENGLQEHLFLIAIQEYLMQQLKLPYQVLMKCTADIGFPNARGVDIEVWLPGQNKYRESHSADYITDFQARRLKTRFKNLDNELGFVYTNDATAIPLSRIPVAILENYQTKDNQVRIPEVLRPYLGNRELL